ncbi:Gfo/Idh/MocA family protein [Bdellovibrio sp. HCB-110]|uniref:Gfo/Idh/MocA family protein n=1 Tax=Bdellovibrio sp. HCB-110 TaxID=3391182 RepID=UPI0039B5E398
MKFLVVGLGSMGKRRIRCLKALGFADIVGFDPREDRVEEAKKLYGVAGTTNLKSLNIGELDGMVISTPPDLHNHYIKMAIDNNKPAFVEASVLIDGLEELQTLAKEQAVFIAPSTTLRFHPIVKDIREIIQSKIYGKITNFSYVSGQYLPDWHPWEDIKDFYVSKKETGGAREIVPFEMTWMTEVFGWPKKVQCVFGKTFNLGVDIDDTYALSMQYDGFIGQLMVDVVARFAQRHLIINLERAQIVWNWNDGAFKVYQADNQRFISYEQPSSSAASGYNKNIVEQMYIDEVKAFVAGIKDSSKYPNSLSEDIKVLKLLLNAEANYKALV